MPASALIEIERLLQEKPVIHIEKIETYADRAHDILMRYGPRVIIALATLLAGFWVISLISKGMLRLMRARDVDPTLRPFLKSITSIGLKILLLLTVAGMIGIQTTSFVAALGAAGLAIGLALQGSLSNFAGGVLILLFKPFRVGDTIESRGHVGTVDEIQILYTTLITADNKKVVIPNGVLSNNDMVNYSALPVRRIDLKLTLAYESDLGKAREIILQLTRSEKRILPDPAPSIGVTGLTDTGVHMDAYFWVQRTDFLPVKYAMYEAVKSAFDKAGIRSPGASVVLMQTLNPGAKA
jgi:small conductance mechanosensitive channel